MIDAPQYLLILYITEWGDDEESPIPSGYVTDALNRSPSTATGHLQNLDAKGFVDYEPYEGATFTAEGYGVAVDLYDTYQVLSRFCRDMPGVNDHEGEAMQLVGNVSPTAAKRLSATLSHSGDDRGRARQAAGSESTSSPDNPAS